MFINDLFVELGQSRNNFRALDVKKKKKSALIRYKYTRLVVNSLFSHLVYLIIPALEDFRERRRDSVGKNLFTL